MPNFDIDITSPVRRPITRVALQALITAGTVSPVVIYRITDAVGATKTIDVFGLTSSTTSVLSFNQSNNLFGYYTISTDLFVGVRELPFAVGGGTVSALTATYDPVLTIDDGRAFILKAKGPNTISNPTLNLGGGAKTVVRNVQRPLFPGDIVDEGMHIFVYDSGSDRYVLLNPAVVNYFEKNTGPGGVAVSASTTTYFHAFGSTLLTSAVESNRHNIIQRPCTISSAKLITRTPQPATGSIIYTLRKNGADTSLIITIPLNGVLGVYSSTGAEVTFAENDTIGWKAVNAATSAASSLIDIAVAGIYF